MTKLTYMKRVLGVALGLVVIVLYVAPALAGDWARFRGPDGSGISSDTQAIPIKWSETENLKWKYKLPGPGSSSPIVVGPRLFVTCWTGYAADPENLGEQKDLRRHLLCLDRDSGKLLWEKSVEPVLPEDPYSGQFTQHGYASHTPVSDGRRVYVFFGKTGVLAFDLDGKQLWQTSVGTGSGQNGWGTASSPILYENLVIVTASAESKALVALSKETGKEVWRCQDPGLGSIWGTPLLVDCGKGRTDLVLAGPNTIWGFDPNHGKIRWQCQALASGSMCSSALAHDGVLYLLETGPKGGGTMAVRAGGEGDVTETHIVWRGKDRARIATPLYEDGRVYWVNSRMAHCIDAATGKLVYQSERLGGGAAPEPSKSRKAGKGSGKRGGGGSQDYASLVLANGRIYWLARSGETFVYAPGPEFKLLGQNSLAADGGDFSATPAISDGQLFIRSSKYLYCVAEPTQGRGK